MRKGRYPTPEERYNISTAEKEKILSRPRCQICERIWPEVEAAYRKRHGREPERRVSNIDHCHSCEAVRGLLCTRCNYWVVGVLEQGETRPRTNPRLQAAAVSYIRNGCECHWRHRLREWAKKRLFAGWSGWQALGAVAMVALGTGLINATDYQVGLIATMAVWAVGRLALLFTGGWRHRARGEDIAYGGWRTVLWCVVLLIAAAAAVVAVIGMALAGLAEMATDNERKSTSSNRRSSTRSGYQKGRSSGGQSGRSYSKRPSGRSNNRRRRPRRYY